MTDHPELTDSINRWARDGTPALDAFFPKVYDELRALARGHLDRAGQRHRPTLQPTVLVNEAYLRLSRRDVTPFANRREFFAFASRIIRHILVDHVRHRLRDKRGAGTERLSLDTVAHVADPPRGLDPVDLLELHQALERLDASYPQQARVVELRFFAGLTQVEIAQVTGLSLATVERHWALGKRRLASWLGRSTSLDQPTSC